MRTRSLLLGATYLSILTLGACAPHGKDRPGQLEKVASFDHQVTGVTVSAQNRIFVNFPRWTEDNAISVAELNKDGSLTPYPNAEWNAWRNVKKSQLSLANHWVCVQSVVADKGSLWVVDAASPAMEGVVKGGAKLVQIDLASNSVTRTYAFDDKVAPKGSYMNDVRIHPDGRHAYLTDSGKGALVVVDLQTGQARRVLDGDLTTKAEKEVVVHADGKELRRPDGRTLEVNADGIALSPDGEALYWQALTGESLYRVPTQLLDNPPSAPGALAKAVERVSLNGVADGLWMDKAGRMYVTSPEEDAIKIRRGPSVPDSQEPTIYVQDKRLRWPDTFSEGPDGMIYVTSSHIQDSPWFNPGAPKEIKTELWRVGPAR